MTKFVFVEKHAEEYRQGIINRAVVVQKYWIKIRRDNQSWSDFAITEEVAKHFRLSERTIWRILRGGK